MNLGNVIIFYFVAGVRIVLMIVAVIYSLRTRARTRTRTYHALPSRALATKSLVMSLKITPRKLATVHYPMTLAATPFQSRIELEIRRHNWAYGDLFRAIRRASGLHNAL